VKVRRIKLRGALKPRNPVAVALAQKRGGEHRKSNKALRRAANAALVRPQD